MYFCQNTASDRVLTNRNFTTIPYVLLRYRPAPEEQILKAFQVLDSDGKGYLTQEELTAAMTNEGLCTVPSGDHTMEYTMQHAVSNASIRFHFTR